MILFWSWSRIDFPLPPRKSFQISTESTLDIPLIVLLMRLHENPLTHNIILSEIWSVGFHHFHNQKKDECKTKRKTINSLPFNHCSMHFNIWICSVYIRTLTYSHVNVEIFIHHLLSSFSTNKLFYHLKVADNRKGFLVEWFGNEKEWRFLVSA